MTRRHVHFLALAGLLLLAIGALAAYSGRATADGSRLDDRNRNNAVCGTSDENSQCPGAVKLVVVPNPHRDQYLVVWQGWYTGTLQDGVRLYARRFDATTGRPEGASIDLAPTGLQYPLAATYDPSTRTYVVAWQPPTDPTIGSGQVRVERFDDWLRPSGVPRTLTGSWDLKALVAEADGRVAVIGAQNEQAVNVPPSAARGSLALRVDTIDAGDRTVSTTTRAIGAPGFVGGLAATYDSAAGNLLVAWLPLIAGQGATSVRIDQLATTGEGHVASLPITPGVPTWQTDLACNERRRDCLLLYAGGGPALANLQAHLLNRDGRPIGRDITVATDTRGPIGAGPTGEGYTFAWSQGGVIAPAGARAVIARLTGSTPRITKILDQTVSGPPQFAAVRITGSGLLVWQSPVDHPRWFQIMGQVIR